jgi:hypothetical protein
MFAGFDGRIFLTKEEWQTYRRRKPVRYVRDRVKSVPRACEVCGNTGNEKNPIQAAHRVPFTLGVIIFGFTPDWLDRPENLAWACRTKCNKQLEWDSEKIKLYLQDRGYVLPSYLGSSKCD